jgi:hypothetical protein
MTAATTDALALPSATPSIPTGNTSSSSNSSSIDVPQMLVVSAAHRCALFPFEFGNLIALPHADTPLHCIDSKQTTTSSTSTSIFGVEMHHSYGAYSLESERLLNEAALEQQHNIAALDVHDDAPLLYRVDQQQKQTRQTTTTTTKTTTTTTTMMTDIRTISTPATTAIYIEQLAHAIKLPSSTSNNNNNLHNKPAQQLQTLEHHAFHSLFIQQATVQSPLLQPNEHATSNSTSSAGAIVVGYADGSVKFALQSSRNPLQLQQLQPLVTLDEPVVLIDTIHLALPGEQGHCIACNHATSQQARALHNNVLLVVGQNGCIVLVEAVLAGDMEQQHMPSSHIVHRLRVPETRIVSICAGRQSLYYTSVRGTVQCVRYEAMAATIGSHHQARSSCAATKSTSGSATTSNTAVGNGTAASTSSGSSSAGGTTSATVQVNTLVPEELCTHFAVARIRVLEHVDKNQTHSVTMIGASVAGRLFRLALDSNQATDRACSAQQASVYRQMQTCLSSIARISEQSVVVHTQDSVRTPRSAVVNCSALQIADNHATWLV